MEWVGRHRPLLISVSLVIFFLRNKLNVNFLGFKDEINLASNVCR